MLRAWYEDLPLQATGARLRWNVRLVCVERGKISGYFGYSVGLGALALRLKPIVDQALCGLYIVWIVRIVVPR